MGFKHTLPQTHKRPLYLAVLTALTCTSVLAEELAEGEYEEIMVTGQKITRTLQETPTSIAVFNAAKMEQQELGNLTETLYEAANVHTTRNSFNIRGIDGFNVSGAGDSALASVYIDNSALPRRLIANGVSTWDISQVEVLRGPQSTLQGRNSLAGAIVMTSQAPTYEWQGKYRLEVGQHGQREAAVAFGGALIEDELAFRFSAENQDFDGFFYNPVREENSDFREDELYRLKLLYQPQGLPDFSAQFNYTRAETTRGPYDVDIPLDGTSPFDHQIVTNNDPQTLIYQTDLFALDMSYVLNENWDLTSITTYATVDTHWKDYDDDNGPLAGGTRFYNEDGKTISQELRLTFDYDKLTGIIGAYYFDQELPSDFGGITRVSLESSGLNTEFLQAALRVDEATANFILTQYEPIDPAILDQDSSLDQSVKTTALFADATYNINDKWDVFAGIRWDREKSDNEDKASFVLVNISDLPNPSNYPSPLNQVIAGLNTQLLNNVTNASKDKPLVDASFNEIIPRIGVSYHINEDITTSFSVQRGYRSGGVGANTANGNVYQFDPEFTTNYEWSLRSIWLDGDLLVNANVFYTDWKDQQVTVQLSTNTFDSEVRNAGKSEVKGFELEANYRLTDEWEFNASVGLADTEFKEFEIRIPTINENGEAGEDIIRDLSGRRFPDAPEWTANTGFTYQGNNGIFANLSLNYADSSPADVNPFDRGLDQNDPNFDLYNDSRTLVNGRIGYEWEEMGIYLVGKNILDKEYIDRTAIGTGRRVVRHTLGSPRQLSLVLRGNF